MPATRDLTLLLKAQDQMSVALREVAAAARSLEGATGGLEKQTAKATSTMRGFGNILLDPAQMIKMSLGFTAMGAGVSALQSAMEATKYAIFGFNSILEQSQVSFSVMTGSADIAKAHLEELQAFATRTPFDFPQLLEASKRLQAYGVEVGNVIPTLQTLGNIAAGVGMEKLPQLILAFGQVQAATRLTGMELRQFSETGVPLLGALATQMGKTTGQIQEMISEGKVSFGEVRKALEGMAGEGGRFGDMMQKQSRTFEGAMSNIRDAASQIGARAFEDLFEKARDSLVGIADNLTGLNKSLKENGEAWQAWSFVVATAMALASSAVITAAGTKIIPALLGIGKVAGIVGGALRLAFSLPGIIIAGGVMAIETWNKAMERSQELIKDIDIAKIISLGEMGIPDIGNVLEKQKEFMQAMKETATMTGGPVIPGIAAPTIDAYIAAAKALDDMRKAARDLVKEGDLSAAATMLQNAGMSAEQAANQVIDWSNNVEKASSAVKDVLEEIIPVMEQLNRANAFRVWREEMKAMLAEGDLEGVIAAFEAIGWTAKATAQEILRMAEENQDALDDIAEKEKRRQKEVADAAIAEAERIVQGTFDAIQAALGRGGTLEEGIAAFAEAEWIRDMGQRIKDALSAGLTPDPELIKAYGTAITNTLDIQRQKAKELEAELIQIKKDSLAAQAKLDADYVAQWVKDLEYQGQQEYEAAQRKARLILDVEDGMLKSLAEIQAKWAVRARNEERQGQAERVEEISKEISFQEFVLATSLAAASERERAKQMLLIQQLREQLFAAETGKPIVMQVNGHELGRVTGWAQNDLTRILARFGV